jgi:two-component system, OmpR family, KDP operon response regulator KdpE
MEDVWIDFVSRQIKIGNIKVRLTKKEFALFYQLYLHAGTAVSYRALLTGVWGKGYETELKYLQDLVRLLRRKIELDPAHPMYLINIRDHGYRFVIPLPK